MQQTNKNAMEIYYDRVVNYLNYADESLREAEKILRSDFVIDGSGYLCNDLSNVRNDIGGYKKEINNRILPAIRNLDR